MDLLAGKWALMELFERFWLFLRFGRSFILITIYNRRLIAVIFIYDLITHSVKVLGILINHKGMDILGPRP